MQTPLRIDDDWICPDLRCYWLLGRDRTTQQLVLQARSSPHRYPLTAAQAFALTHFTGQFSVRHVQQVCEQKFADLPPGFVKQLYQQLADWKILALDDSTEQIPANSVPPGPVLKACVHWIQTDDGYWILRNPETLTFMQLDDRARQVIERLGTAPVQAIAQTYDLSPSEMRLLLQQLTVTAMLEGTQPPIAPRKKFTPLQLLYFKLPLWNPDAWLSESINRLRWIWTREFWWSLCFLLAGTGAIALHQRTDLLKTAQLFLTHPSLGSTVTFALLSLLVVTLHELGHAFTLKHYGGLVPEVGMMVMMFMPIAYTNTTDQYSLPKRSQRMQVVGAGVICQLAIAAIAFWLWNVFATGTSLWTCSYLLLTAALFTVAINLNPLAKFDGYYLTVAMTGINNLRQRSFAWYQDWLTGKPSPEQGRDRWMLAAYAPFSLLYTLSVFGFLLVQVADWTLTHIPVTALVLVSLWAVYFYWPTDGNA